MTVGVAVAVARSRRRVVESLREQGAFGPSTSSPLDLHRPLDRRTLSRLLRAGVVIADGSDRYHLDSAALRVSDERRRRLKVGLLAGSAAAAGVVLLASLL